MDTPAALIARLVAALPGVPEAAIADAMGAVLRGEPATVDGRALGVTFGSDNRFDQATITLGDIAGGHIIKPIIVNLPQPIDRLPAALATFAALPLDHLPEATTILPATSRMPFARNGQFVGRERDLLTLALAMADPAPTVMVSAVAAGLGGLGKTSLAVEFAYRYGRYFAGGVFWLHCADPATIPSEVAVCAGALGLPVAGQPLDDQVAAVRRAWEDAIPRLLIFDNCEDPQVLEAWRPPHGGCRVLVTARRGNWPKTLYQVALGVLDRPDSSTLLVQFCPRLTPAEADGLAEDLGDLPLALHLAGSYLQTYDHVTVAAYRAQLSLNHDSLKGRGTESLPTRHERDVARTFALSYDQLDETNPIDILARWLLACAAQLAPGVPIPRDLLLAMVAEGTTPEDAIDALGRLRVLGLLDGEAALVLHRLLAGYVRQQPDVPVVRDVIEQTVIDQAYQINEAGLPAAMAPILPHLRAVAQTADERADKQVAMLLSNLGYHLAAMGDYGGARPLLERALAIYETALGPNHPDTARSLNNLAGLLESTGDYGGARSLYERALAIYEVALGADHPDTARSLNDLAYLLESTGDYGGARSLYERALAIYEVALGADHPDIASSLHNLAHLLQSTGNYSEARRLYERALVIYEVALGADHPDTARSLNNLAHLLGAIGDYGGARPLYARALVITEAALGPSHPDTATSLNNLAALLDATGDYSAAKPLYERALVITEAALGPSHPDTAMSLNNLAALLRATGDYSGARPLYERALVITEAVLGPSHPDTATSLNNLAALLYTTGDSGEARPLLEQALTIYERALGLDHPDAQRTRRNLARCLAALDQAAPERTPAPEDG